MRQALVPYLRTYDSRKQKCKHPRSKAKGGVEGGVGRLSAAGEFQHCERAAWSLGAMRERSWCVENQRCAPPESRWRQPDSLYSHADQNGDIYRTICMHNKCCSAQRKFARGRLN